MRIPVIGITMSCDEREKKYDSRTAYAESIGRAGGLPLLIPADGALADAAEYAALLDGILFAGGGDIHPAYFGEEPLDGFEMGSLQPERDWFEIGLCREAEKNRLPMLGICRGLQLMAVAGGGSIWQDIDSKVKRQPRIRHMQKAPDWCTTHRIKIVPDTRLAGIFQAGELMTNSFHHQAVREIPPGYRVSAVSSDGIIEAMESERLPFAVGVQWHPERVAVCEKDTAELFRYFVSCAAKKRDEK